MVHFSRVQYSADVDTTQLDTATAQQVKQLVQSLDFFNLSAIVPEKVVGADLIRYDVTVSEGDRQHTVTLADDGSPEIAPLRRLVDTLIQIG